MAYYQNIVETVTGGTTKASHKSYVANLIANIIKRNSNGYFNVITYADINVAISATNCAILESVDNLIKLRVYDTNTNNQMTIELSYISNSTINSNTLSFTEISTNPFTSTISLKKLHLKNGFVLLNGLNNFPIITKGTCTEELNSGNLDIVFVGTLVYNATYLKCAIADGTNNTNFFITGIVNGFNPRHDLLVKHNAVITQESSLSGILKFEKHVKNIIASQGNIGYTGFLNIDNEIYYHTGFFGYLLEDL